MPNDKLQKHRMEILLGILQLDEYELARNEKLKAKFISPVCLSEYTHPLLQLPERLYANDDIYNIQVMKTILNLLIMNNDIKDYILYE